MTITLTKSEYGYYLIDELDELELPEEAKKYFMYEEYGRDATINDGGRFTDQGYIYNNKVVMISRRTLTC